MPRDPAVEAYLARLPPPHRAALKRLRKQILAVVPGATERISYQMPGFEVDGRMVAWMAAFTEHCSLFPPTHRFAPDEGLPDAVVKKVVKTRLAQNRAAAAKRATRAKTSKRPEKAPQRRTARRPAAKRRAT